MAGRTFGLMLGNAHACAMVSLATVPWPGQRKLRACRKAQLGAESTRESCCVCVCAHPSASAWTAAQSSHSHEMCAEPTDSSAQRRSEGGGEGGLTNPGRPRDAPARATNPHRHNGRT